MLTSLHLKLRPPPSTPPTWSLTCNPSLSMLGCTALSAIPSGIAPNPRLIQLALAKPLEGIQATILSVKAKDDHAQQISSSALKMVPAAAAAAAASATRTYTPTAAVTLKPPPSPTAQIPRTKASAPPPLPPLLPPAPEAISPLQLPPLCLLRHPPPHRPAPRLYCKLLSPCIHTMTIWRRPPSNASPLKIIRTKLSVLPWPLSPGLRPPRRSSSPKNHSRCSARRV